MQLLNLQNSKYPTHFPETKWTCMNSIYNQSIQACIQKLTDFRAEQKKSGTCSKVVDWGTVDADLYYYAAGFNTVWGNRSWEDCDYILGVDNIDQSHWMAYRYNFNTLTIEIYDSMLKSFKGKRAEVAQRHAAIAPSLYNVKIAKEEDMLDPDVPFGIAYVEDMPQQLNGWDCGVYAVKVIQCLTMQDNYTQLLPGNFKDYRKKMAIDLIKWLQKSGKFCLEEKKIFI